MSLWACYGVIYGVACLVASFSLGIQHILTAPSVKTWPTWVGWMRVLVFLLCAGMLMRGMTILSNLDSPIGQVPPETALLAVLISIYFAAMMIDTLRQNYPERVWQALERLHSLASCQPNNPLPEIVVRGAAGTLSSRGVVVNADLGPPHPTIDNSALH